jgi:hypothetical protein
VLSSALNENKARTPKVLQVLRGVGDGEAGQFGQDLNASLALREEVEQFEARGAAEGTGDRRHVFKERSLHAVA